MERGMKLVSFFFLFLLSSACSPVSRKKRNYRIQKSLTREGRMQVIYPRPVLSSLNVRLKKPSWTRGKLERESDKKGGKRKKKAESSGRKGRGEDRDEGRGGKRIHKAYIGRIWNQ